MNFLIVLIVVLMFCASCYSADEVVKNGKVEETGLVAKGNHLTNAACYAITAITIFYDVAGVLIIFKLV